MAVALEVVGLAGGGRGRVGRHQHVGAINPVYPVEIGVGQRQAGDGHVHRRNGVEGLFMLAPAGIADKALVADQEALAADHELGVEIRGVGQLQPVQRRHRRVGDYGIGGLAVAGTVIGRAANRPYLVEIGLQRQAVPASGFVSQAGAQGQRVGVNRLARVTDRFIPAAQVDHQPAFRDGVDDRGLGLNR